MQPQLDYKGDAEIPSYYKNVWSLQPNGSPSTFLCGQSLQQVNFEIPAGALNLSKTILRYQLDFPVTATTKVASGTQPGPDQVILPLNCISEINALRCTTASSSQEIFYLRDFDLVSKMLCALNLNGKRPLEERVITERVIVSTKAQGTGVEWQKITLDSDTTDYSNNDLGSYVSFEGQPVPGSGTTPAGIDPTKSINVNICLADLLPKSVFGMDKTIYFDSSVRIEITFSPNTNAFGVIKRPTELTFDTKVTTLESTANYQVANIRLDYFSETNPKVVEMCKNANFTLHFPYIYQSSSTNSGIGYQQNSYRIGRSNERLLETYSALFKRGGTASFYRCWSGIFDGHWTGCQLKINEDIVLNIVGQNPSNTSTTSSSDYIGHIRSLVKGRDTALTSTNNILSYGVVPFFFDTDYKNISDFDSNSLKGLSLADKDVYITTLFNVAAISDGNTASAYENYVVAVVLKTMTYSNGKIMF